MPLSRFFCTRWSHLFRPLLGLVLLSLSSTWARATHLVGGEMTYTHLGNNQYQITLTVYRDCGPTNTLGTGFDDQVYVGLWDGTGQIQPNDVVTMGLAGSNVSNVPVVLGNPCGTPPEELCIEKAIYTTVVSFAAHHVWMGPDLATVLQKPLHQQPPELRWHRQPRRHPRGPRAGGCPRTD